MITSKSEFKFALDMEKTCKLALIIPEIEKELRCLVADIEKARKLTRSILAKSSKEQTQAVNKKLRAVFDVLFCRMN